MNIFVFSFRDSDDKSHRVKIVAPNVGIATRTFCLRFADQWTFSVEHEAPAIMGE